MIPPEAGDGKLAVFSYKVLDNCAALAFGLRRQSCKLAGSEISPSQRVNGAPLAGDDLWLDRLPLDCGSIVCGELRTSERALDSDRLAPWRPQAPALSTLPVKSR
jgi:hypothetical protein